MIYRHLRLGTVMLCFIAHGHEWTNREMFKILCDAVSEGHELIIKWIPSDMITGNMWNIFKLASASGRLNIIELFPTYKDSDYLISCIYDAIDHGHNRIMEALINRIDQDEVPLTCLFSMISTAANCENVEALEYLWPKIPQHFKNDILCHMERNAKHKNLQKTLKWLNSA